jgi:hypothetical protein
MEEKNMASTEIRLCNEIIHSTSAAAATIGRAASQALIGWIPGIGNIINATTAAAITEAIGMNLRDRLIMYRR